MSDKDEKFIASVELLNKIVAQYDSMNAFGRAIHEHTSDVSRWCAGKQAIKLRTVIEICRLHPKIKPYQLNSVLFPDDLEFIFNKKRK